MTTPSRTNWLVPTGLIVLSVVPVLASGIRVAELSGAVDVAVTMDNERFFVAPVPILVHVVSASLFSVIGALQFVPGLRRHRWHRHAGRVLVPLGLAVAGSALWMTVTYPLPARDSVLLSAFRLLFGSGMALSILLGTAALRRGDFAGHGAWMTRGYAIAVGAGTQGVLLGFWEAAVGGPGVFARALLHGAAWVLNLAVAETAIRRRTRSSRVPTPAHAHAA
ncbi:DUF2306 domain-containing protein [Nocardia sp. CA-135953]|uniref:DUF2306 domain-containing protein n=1 Tax=Nocardia sp. CA-135953 TaxID=3239978 RepID=UPI003D97C7FA